MKRSRIQVLIVDDDATQGKALLEAFKRAGYEATWCNSSVQAITVAQRQEFHCLLVDCMLPKMNGVDLVEEVLQFNVRKPKVFLFSGIFKDKNFQKEAIARTQCEAFLLKPLDIESFLAKVDYAFRTELEAEEEPTINLYSEHVMNEAEIVSFITAHSPLHAFHIPMLLKHIIKSRLTGELTLVNSQGEVNTLAIYDGQIFRVETPDRETYFGGLAVGYGFVSPDDVIEALKTPSPKLLGVKLIESFALSPHAINVILEEQLALRLSQCIRDDVLSLQWVAQTYTTPSYALNPARFVGLIDDWIRSKIEMPFLMNMFQTWGRYQISGKFHETIDQATSINQLISHPAFNAERDLHEVFRQLLHRNAWLGAAIEESLRDFTFLESRLDQMLAGQKNQSFFQILGIGETAKSLELNRAYQELKAHFDPSTLPSNCPASVIVKATKVYRAIEKAYSVLNDDLERPRYISQLHNKRSQQLFENEPIFRAAIIELHNGQPKMASRKFQSLIDNKMDFKDLKAYRIWAGLKMDRTYRALTLDQVPPEERHSAPYMMAKGLYYRNKGNFQKALEAFRTAHVLDPRSNIAAHELKKLAAYIQKYRGSEGNLLKEVTSVVENMVTKISRRGA